MSDEPVDPLGDKDTANLIWSPPKVDEDPSSAGGFTASTPSAICAGCGLRVPAVWFTVPPGRTMEDAIPECNECHERSVASRDTMAAELAKEAAPNVYMSKSGAKSSERKPAYHLVPLLPLLDRVSERFRLGAERYGVDNWRKGIGEREFLIERGNHALSHLVRVLEKLKDGAPSDFGDDDLAAIAWFCLVLAESEDTVTTHDVTRENGDEATDR